VLLASEAAFDVVYDVFDTLSARSMMKWLWCMFSALQCVSQKNFCLALHKLCLFCIVQVCIVQFSDSCSHLIRHRWACFYLDAVSPSLPVCTWYVKALDVLTRFSFWRHFAIHVVLYLVSVVLAGCSEKGKRLQLKPLCPLRLEPVMSSWLASLNPFYIYCEVVLQ